METLNKHGVKSLEINKLVDEIDYRVDVKN
jgi:hypothetical protein